MLGENIDIEDKKKKNKVLNTMTLGTVDEEEEVDYDLPRKFHTDRPSKSIIT